MYLNVQIDIVRAERLFLFNDEIFLKDLVCISYIIMRFILMIII